MSYTMNEQGPAALAKIVADSGKINGMYIEYGGPTCSGARRDQAYFEALKASPGHGYIRVPVTHSYADGARVYFVALVSRADLPEDASEDMLFTCVSAIVLGATPDEDVVVCTSDITPGVGVVRNAYTTITTSIVIG